MKKKLIAAAALSAFLCTGITVPAEAAKSVPVTLPTFDVTLNGTVVENNNRQYPLLVYNNITYVPMTYYDCRFLGLETAWNQKDGLGIKKSDLTGAYYDYKTAKKNNKRGTAQIASGKIKVNGKEIHNASEKYPLLLYRDVTYFPLTWRFAVNEFGWKYQFDNKNGLVITSNNTQTEKIAVTDGRNIKDEYTIFDFAIDDKNLYYQGVNGAIHSRPLSALQSDVKRKTVAQVPYENDYFEGYPAAQLYEENGSVYYRYHSGGASMGGDYLYRIQENAEPQKLLGWTYDEYVNFDEFAIEIAGTRIGGRPPIAMTYIAKDGSRSELGPNGYLYAASADGYDEKRNSLYVSARESDPEINYYGTSYIYAIDLENGSMTKLTELDSGNYAVTEDEVYFAYSYLLYMHDLETGEDRLVSNESLDRNFNYAPIKTGVYFATQKDGQRFCFWDKAAGKTAVLNPKGLISELDGQNGYVIARFEETPDNPYRLMVFDANGKQVYTSADVADKAVINKNGVLVYRLAGTNQLVKVQL